MLHAFALRRKSAQENNISAYVNKEQDCCPMTIHFACTGRTKGLNGDESMSAIVGGFLIELLSLLSIVRIFCWLVNGISKGK